MDEVYIVDTGVQRAHARSSAGLALLGFVQSLAREAKPGNAGHHKLVAQYEQVFGLLRSPDDCGGDA